MSRFDRRFSAAVVFVFLFVFSSHAQSFGIGNPRVTSVWVDPERGSDTNSGVSRVAALRTLTAAWNRIPRATPLGTGVEVLITAGRLDRSAIPNYLESRYGTFSAPIIFRAVDGPGSVVLAGDLNIFDVRYLYLIGLTVDPEPAGDAFHCEKCDHVLLRNVRLNGGNRQAHETLKINQSQYIYIEDSELTGADDNVIDFVAVQFGHVVRNRISNAGDWCMYVKGGSAHLEISGNEISRCGTGGFTAGQGTGLQFMTPPWIHYEAYDVRVTNNVIHDTQGAGLGVNGGFNILLAHNTLYRTGSRSHMIEVVYGSRSCDGVEGAADRAFCRTYLELGGWGTTRVDDGINYVRIPNRNVFIYNNLLFNPPGFISPAHLVVAAPYSGASQDGSNVPSPAVAADNLRIEGNLIFNGLPGHDSGLGAESGCAPSNNSCNEMLLNLRNTINRFEPRLVDPAAGNFRPQTGALAGHTSVLIPDFPSGGLPSRPVLPTCCPLSNAVRADRDGRLRGVLSTVGAYLDGIATAIRRRGARG